MKARVSYQVRQIGNCWFVGITGVELPKEQEFYAQMFHCQTQSDAQAFVKRVQEKLKEKGYYLPEGQ